jgi:UDP-glucuronate 4-epimerase
MKIIVTGTAGFIGFHLAKKLLAEGNEVIGLDNINDYYDPNLKYARLNELGINRSDIKEEKLVSSSVYPLHKFIKLNLEDKQGIDRLFEREKFDIVINLAAQAGVRYSIENPDVYIQSNITGFYNLLEACRHNPVKHFVFASSSSIYGDSKDVPFREDAVVDTPISLYAATKKSGELMAYTYSSLFKIPLTGLRFFTVYGPWGRPDMALSLFTEKINNGEPIKVFNQGNLSRDFTYIDDIVAGVSLVTNKIPPQEEGKPPTESSISAITPRFNLWILSPP